MTDVALREHLEGKFRDGFQLLEAQIRAERELRELDTRRSAEALELQTLELSRRLDILNGQHKWLEQISDSFLRRDTFEDWLKHRSEADERLREADLTWKRAADKQLSEQRGATNRSFAILTVGLALLSIVLRFWP